MTVQSKASSLSNVSSNEPPLKKQKVEHSSKSSACIHLPSLSSLPRDWHREICSYLPLDDFINLRKSSKLFSNVSELAPIENPSFTSSMLCKKRVLGDIATLSAQWQEALQKKGASVKMIYLEEVRFANVDSIYRIGTVFPSIETIKLSGNKTELPFILPLLTKLPLKCVTLRNEQFFQKIAECLEKKSLMQLYLENVEGVDEVSLEKLKDLPLEKLHLGNCTEISGIALRHLSCMPLKELHLEFCNYQSPQHPSLPNKSITDDHLKFLVNFSLESLSLEGNFGITGAGFQYLAHMPLSWLRLKRTQVSDERLQQLAHLPIKSLSLDDCIFIKGTGFKFFSKMPLERFSCEGTRVTDEHLQHLAQLPLKALSFENCFRITDEGLKFFPKTVENLWLDNTNVTDDSFKYLRHLPLKILSLFSCKKITGEGIAELAQTPVEDLNVIKTSITDECLQKMAEVLPKTLQILRCNKISDTTRSLLLTKLPHLRFQEST